MFPLLELSAISSERLYWRNSESMYANWVCDENVSSRRELPGEIGGEDMGKLLKLPQHLVVLQVWYAIQLCRKQTVGV